MGSNPIIGTSVNAIFIGKIVTSCDFVDSNGQTIWIVNAHREDGRRFIVAADEKLSAFVELERQVLTVTFYLESIRGGDQ
jgi:putative heme iron utilization protein